MGSDPCTELSNALRQNSTLEVLFVNGNALDEQGARKLAEALTVNKTLQHLGMGVSSLTSVLFMSFAMAATTARASFSSTPAR